MTRSDALEKLRELLGAEAVVEHAPLEIDGVKLEVTLRPADPSALALAVGALSRLSLAAVVRGAGTQSGVGNPPRRADVLLSTERLVGVEAIDADEGVCHALAGTPVAELRAAANRAGWELPLDAPGSVGGAIAAASVGARSLGWGRPRDVVLGLEVALTSGQRVRSGGRVVKNVTGYDLNKVYTGSFGTLGVIESAWLRLRPLPERVQLGEAYAPDVESACAVGLAAARRSTARAAAIAGPTDRGFSLVVELAGDAPSVEADLAWLRSETGAADVDAEALERVRVQQSADPGDAGVRFRLSSVASRLPELLARLRGAGAEVLAYPGLGLAWAGFSLADRDAQGAVDRVFAQVQSAAAEAEGGFRLDAAPAWAKQGRDVFGPTTAQPLFEALKQRFDPGRNLNPGRFAGHI